MHPILSANREFRYIYRNNFLLALGSFSSVRELTGLLP